MQLLLKIGGTILIVSCTTLIGISLAGLLKKRVNLLEAAIAALGVLEGELSYGMLAPDEAVFRMEQYESLSELAFLPQCAALCRQGSPFPNAWKKSLETQRSELSKEDTAILCALADTIGQCDLESQIAAIRQAKELLAVQLRQARTRCESHTKIYHTMGVLSGIFIVIVSI